MATYVLLALLVAFASMVQSSIGFGAAVLMMNTLPFFLDIQLSMIVAQTCCLALSASVILRYRSHVRWKVLVPTLLPALVLAALGATVSSRLQVENLKFILGILFICLSLYFSLLSSRIKISPTPLSGFLIGSISGAMNGLFSMGGPPAVLYLAPALEKKEEYLATSQVFFITTNLMSLSIRIANGVADASALPLIAAGVPAAIAGTFLGKLVVDHIKPSLLKKLIYLMIGVNGAIIVLKHFI